MIIWCHVICWRTTFCTQYFWVGVFAIGIGASSLWISIFAWALPHIWTQPSNQQHRSKRSAIFFPRNIHRIMLWMLFLLCSVFVLVTILLLMLLLPLIIWFKRENIKWWNSVCMLRFLFESERKKNEKENATHNITYRSAKVAEPFHRPKSGTHSMRIHHHHSATAR